MKVGKMDSRMKHTEKEAFGSVMYMQTLLGASEISKVPPGGMCFA